LRAPPPPAAAEIYPCVFLFSSSILCDFRNSSSSSACRPAVCPRPGARAHHAGGGRLLPAGRLGPSPENSKNRRDGPTSGTWYLGGHLWYLVPRRPPLVPGTSEATSGTWYLRLAQPQGPLAGAFLKERMSWTSPSLAGLSRTTTWTALSRFRFSPRSPRPPDDRDGSLDCFARVPHA